MFPLNVIWSATAGVLEIGGTFAVVICGAAPGVPPRGVVRTTCDGGSVRAGRQVRPHPVHRLDEIVVERNEVRVVSRQRRVVDERVEVLRISHLDIDELARGAFDELVLTEIRAARSS